jgi:hypothetical protein
MAKTKHELALERDRALHRQAAEILPEVIGDFGRVYDLLPSNGILEDDARMIYKLLRRLEDDLRLAMV